MEEKIYSVSEAVRLVGVESHVLRYWEEELKIPIRRSSQGHRLYSERDIELFGKVREWRQKGLQLKAIRLLLNKEDVAEEAVDFDRQVKTIAYDEQGINEQGIDEQEAQSYEIVSTEDTKENLEKFMLILKQMMKEVTEEQDRRLEQMISDAVRDEMETLYFEYIQIMREAAAEKNRDRNLWYRLRQFMERIFRIK
ncbi:MAG: helix-turn-helix domain-containing protein [Lachnospiraceae bacterium]|nr:helix-turn-helix domain-containing protein [Lachnospiraceae bacterium]MDD7077931.1 helix-turn-helix domain-containing protein [Lachnospiraceae bacterium]MDY3728884.1 helix-turn-helix domain-containing protein [Candidatus Choladocola sp.]